MLIEPGDRVLVEEPSYLAALQAFALAGAVVVPWRATATASIPTPSPRRRARRAGAVHDPDVPQPDRAHAAARAPARAGAGAERCGLWLIEGDPYGELRYRGEPLPSLATMAGGRTLALSTLSKVAAPGLRIGWVRAPEALRRSLVVAKQAADLHSSTVDQAAAARRLARSTSTPTSACCAPGTGGAAMPCSTGRRPRCRRARPITGRRAACPCGARAGRLGRGAAARSGARADVAFVTGHPFFPGQPDRAAR